MFDMIVYDMSSVCYYGMDGGDYIHHSIKIFFDFDVGDDCPSFDRATDKCDGCGACFMTSADVVSSFKDI